MPGESRPAPPDDPALPSRGGLGATISNQIVGLLREHGGKGPTKCKTYFDDDLVIVLLRGGFTIADRTMFEAGKWLNVREAKQVFQDSIEVQLTEVIGRLTDRTVLAFMSASHQQPDLMIEAFLLDAPLAFTGPATDDSVAEAAL